MKGLNTCNLAPSVFIFISTPLLHIAFETLLRTFLQGLTLYLANQEKNRNQTNGLTSPQIERHGERHRETKRDQREIEKTDKQTDRHTYRHRETKRDRERQSAEMSGGRKSRPDGGGHLLDGCSISRKICCARPGRLLC